MAAATGSAYAGPGANLPATGPHGRPDVQEAPMRSTVTLSGNVVTDVALRATSGGPVASFRMAATESWWDKRTERWAERVTYLQVSAWRQLAEHVADSLAKGQPVVVVGRLRQRESTTGRRCTARPSRSTPTWSATTSPGASELHAATSRPADRGDRGPRAVLRGACGPSGDDVAPQGVSAA